MSGQGYAGDCGPRRLPTGGCARYVPKFCSLIIGDLYSGLDPALGATTSMGSPRRVLELNESITAGLCREVKEGTGLDVAPDVLTGVYKNMTHCIVALVFRRKILGGQLASNREVAEFHEATAAEVPGMTQRGLRHPGHRCAERCCARCTPPRRHPPAEQARLCPHHDCLPSGSLLA